MRSLSYLKDISRSTGHIPSCRDLVIHPLSRRQVLKSSWLGSLPVTGTELLAGIKEQGWEWP
jgi:hypothetical protein